MVSELHQGLITGVCREPEDSSQRSWSPKQEDIHKASKPKTEFHNAVFLKLVVLCRVHSVIIRFRV